MDARAHAMATCRGQAQKQKKKNKKNILYLVQGLLYGNAEKYVILPILDKLSKKVLTLPCPSVKYTGKVHFYVSREV